MSTPQGRVAGILLVPNAENLAQLDAGPCGFRPPTVERTREYPDWPLSTDPPPQDPGWWTAWRPRNRDNAGSLRRTLGSSYERALVLAWDGVPLAVGCWLAREAMLLQAVGDVEEHVCTRQGRIVLVDVYGREVPIVPAIYLLPKTLRVDPAYVDALLTALGDEPAEGGEKKTPGSVDTCGKDR